MKTEKMLALKGCPYQKEGAVFMANPRDAKALIAIGKAQRYIEPEGTDSDGVADPAQIESTEITGDDVSMHEPTGGVTGMSAELESKQVGSAQAGAYLTREIAGAPFDRELITPDAYELAAEHGIDYRTVKGTGAGGRVLKSDIAACINT